MGQVVDQQVAPDFLLHHHTCLASQHVHLHGPLDRAQIQLRLPGRGEKMRSQVSASFPWIRSTMSLTVSTELERKDPSRMNPWSRFWNCVKVVRPIGWHTGGLLVG
jgi:hypothetical protein